MSKATKIPVLGTSEIKRTFGDFDFRSNRDGSIDIQGDFESKNIVRATLVGIPDKNGVLRDKEVECHRLIKPSLEAAFQEVKERGLSRLIITYNGLFVPRHMTWNPKRSLSHHSWGIAFDLNAATNGYGDSTPSPENIALNEIFNDYGYSWGGDWNDPYEDPMHWEMANLKRAADAVARREDRKVFTVSQAQPRLILAVQHPKRPGSIGAQKPDSDWSYFAIANSSVVNGTFSVAYSAVADALKLESFPEKFARLKALGFSRLRDFLEAGGYTVVKTSSHAKDLADPRVYVFVKPQHAGLH